MRNIRQPRQVMAAWALTGVYAVFWLLLSTHHFFGPEHQHEKKVCRHAPNETHFHGEEYASDECSICQFTPAKAELLQFEFSATLLPLGFPKPFFGDTDLFAVSPLAFSQPRAPPVRLA